MAGKREISASPSTPKRLKSVEDLPEDDAAAKIILEYVEKSVSNPSKFAVTRPYRQFEICVNSNYGYGYEKDKVLSSNPEEILATIASSPSLNNHLRDLTLRYVPLSADIHGTLSSLEMLTSLTMVSCSVKDSITVQPAEMKSLRHLKVEWSGCKIISLLNCKELDTLNIQTKHLDIHVVNFLKQLDVVHQEILIRDGNFRFFASSRESLARVSLQYISLLGGSEVMMKYLNDSIKTLTFDKRNLDTKFIDALQQLNAVEKVDLNVRIEDAAFKKLIEKLPNVKEMILSNCFDFNSAKLMNMSVIMKNLTHLVISQRSRILSLFGTDLSSVKFTKIRSLAVTLQVQYDDDGCVPQGYDQESAEKLRQFCATNPTLKHMDVKSFGGPCYQVTRCGGRVVAENSLICIYKDCASKGTSVETCNLHITRAPNDTMGSVPKDREEIELEVFGRELNEDEKQFSTFIEIVN